MSSRSERIKGRVPKQTPVSPAVPKPLHAMEDGPGVNLRARFMAFDDLLMTQGVPPCNDWWRGHIGRWLDLYEKKGVLRLTGCVGRGAAKTTTMLKLAMFFTLEGNFNIPPGEVHWAVVISRRKSEATKSVAIIGRWLQLLGVRARITGETIILEELRRGILVVAAAVGAASGWRAFFVAKDERSKWKLVGIDEEAADEVDTSAAAMTATHPFAPIVTVGSAWGNQGFFYDTIRKGTTDFDYVIPATPTWIAAPHISEESCHRKEPDKRKFLREYASEFQADKMTAFDPDLVDAAFQSPCGFCNGEIKFWCGLPRDHDGWHKDFRDIPDHISKYTRCEKILLLDPSGGGSDTFAYATAGWRYFEHLDEAGNPLCYDDGLEVPTTYRLVFDWVGGVAHAAQRGVDSDAIVDEIYYECIQQGAKHVHSDQYSAFALSPAFKKKGLHFTSHSWKSQNKEAAVERVRAWLDDGVLVFGDASISDPSVPSFAKMRRELRDFEEKFAQSGALTFRGRQGGHDDFAMLVMLAALVDIEKGLPGSPLFNARHQEAEDVGLVGERSVENSLGVASDALLDGLAIELD
jgi:hypothetical protein